MARVLADIMENQLELIQRIEANKKNLLKLPFERRTEENLKQKADNLKVLKETFNANHEKLMGIDGNLLPEEYSREYLRAKQDLQESKQFIKMHFPNLIDNESDEETNDDNNEEEEEEDVKEQIEEEKLDEAAGGEQIKPTITEKLEKSTGAKRKVNEIEELKRKILEMENLQLKNELTMQAWKAETKAAKKEQKKKDVIINEPITMPAEKSIDSMSISDFMKLFSKDKQQSVKVQPIEIPRFDGKIAEYKSFRDLFYATAKNSTRRPIEHMALLLSKLDGLAKDSVQCLEINDENYEEAWKILDKRFFDPRVQFDEAMKAIEEAPIIIKKDADSMLQLMRTYQGVINNLKGQNVSPSFEFAWMVRKKLDPYTLGRFLQSTEKSKTLISITELNEFLEKEYSNLRAVSSHSQKSHAAITKAAKEIVTTEKKISKAVSKTFATYGEVEREKRVKMIPPYIQCLICAKNHYAVDCYQLANAKNKYDLLRQHHVCVHCASHPYKYNEPCVNRGKLVCDLCGKPHATVLHLHSNNQTPSNNPNRQTRSMLARIESDASSSGVLLPTAIVDLQLSNGEKVSVRALLDGASQANYITEDVVQKLKLRKKRVCVTVKGIGGKTQIVQSLVAIFLKFPNSKLPALKIKALVIKSVAGQLPTVKSVRNNKMEEGMTLADPKYHLPSKISLLLGAGILSEILLDGVKSEDGKLWQNTRFGWIVSGQPTPGSTAAISVTSNHVALSEFELNLQKFWDMPAEIQEEDNDANDFCIQQFNKEVTRDETGRYIVPTPFIPDAPKLGDSYTKARKCFFAQEKKWENDPQHGDLAKANINNYIKLGHMSYIPAAERRNRTGNVSYLPYHGVIRKDAVTTKLRTVYNASSKSSTGVSLNDVIYPGPKTQTSIFDIITRARLSKVVFGADVEMMYRQIWLKPEDRDMHRIVFRNKPSQSLQEYRLNTVTFGIDCAPFQAISTLHRIADDHATDEKTKNRIKKCFYVDDLLTGADNVQSAQDRIRKIHSTLKEGHFPLSKWFSNDEQALHDIPREKRLEAYVDLEKQPIIKSLGLNYHTEEDWYSLRISSPKTITFTKRGLLSLTASIYDPIGFAIPIIIKLRILVQKLWLNKLEWDQEVDDELRNQFEKCLTTLDVLQDFKVQRWLGTNETTELQLIGFSDASADAFSACIYSRCKVNDMWEVRLLAAKARVAPLKARAKNICTIPKMELESTALLIELYLSVVKALDHPTTFICYSDSEVVIAWMRSQKPIENKFVKRRINKIKKHIQGSDIHHVAGIENPADVASRGCFPSKFINNKLWLNGPAWMLQDELPTTPFVSEVISLSNVDNEMIVEFVEKFSDYYKMLRSAAYWLRLKTFMRTKQMKKGALTAIEFRTARLAVLRMQQLRSFPEEIQLLESQKPLPRKHWMNYLDVFIADDHLLKVGGRLARSSTVSITRKHPILLRKCVLVDLLITHTHESLGHAALKLTIREIQENYWIPQITSRVKKIIHRCVICVRWRAKTFSPITADLPEVRVEPAAPFSSTGVDLCGFFMIKASKVKFDRMIKTYIVVFVCMSTKSVHLELCTELSTENFLNAFARFTSRRNTPLHLYSDNGTNFRGADRLEQQAWLMIQQESIERLAIKEIEWHFIPPGSPSYGGIWESAVKSVKYFINRMANVQALTYEDFNTLTCIVEGYLNLRPLERNSSGPKDDLALTPFHFLTQRSATISAVEVMAQRMPLSKRWLEIRQILSQVWQRFSTDYVSELHKRYKKKFPTRNIAIDDVVVIKDHETSPAEWALGRVVNVYPDRKGNIRHADVKTAKKDPIYRAVDKLVPLFEDSEEPIDVPAPRRSTRIKKKSTKTSLLTKALIVSLAATHVSDALMITKLDAGVYMHPTEDIALKTSELFYQVSTTLNITEDFRLIDSQVNNFHELCFRYQKPQYKSIYDHCNGLAKTTEFEARGIKQQISEQLEPQPTKRSIAIWLSRGISASLRLGSVAIKSPVVKILPHVALAGGMVYQQVKNDFLEEEIKNIKAENQNMNSNLKRLSDINYNTTTRGFNQVTEQQDVILMQERIVDYSTSIHALINAVKIRFDNILQTKPLDSLLSYLNSLEDKSSKIMAMDPAQNVFSFNPKKVFVDQDNLVNLLFKIPMVSAEPWKLYTLVSLPSREGGVVLFDNYKRQQKIIVNRDQTLYFLPKNADKAAIGVYQAAIPLPLTSCVDAIFNNKLDIWRKCIVKPVDNVESEIIPISQEAIVVISNNDAIMNCKEVKERIIFPYSYIEMPDCVVTLERVHSTETGLHATQGYHINITTENIAALELVSDFTVAPINREDNEREELSKKIDRDIADTKKEQPKSWWRGILQWIAGFIAVIAMIGTLITCFIKWIIGYIRNNRDIEDEIEMHERREWADEWLAAVRRNDPDQRDQQE